MKRFLIIQDKTCQRLKLKETLPNFPGTHKQFETIKKI